MKFPLLLFLLLSKLVVSCRDLDFIVKVVKMISNSDYFGFFLILYSEEDGSAKLCYEKFAKIFHIRMKYSMMDFIPLEEYQEYEVKNENMKCLKILNGGSENIRTKFINLSNEIDLGDGDMWLLFLDEPLEPYLNLLKLPFHVQLVTAKVQNSSVHLRAPYKVAKDFPLRIQSLGSWDETNFTASEPLLDISRRDMEGVRLTAGTINYPPVTSIKHYKNGKFSVHGYLIEIWKEVGEKLNFTYNYILPPDKGVGSKNADGSWNGLMGMMMRNEIDVIVTSLIMTPARNMDVHFSVPTMISGFQVYFLESGSELEWESLVRPFRKESWFALLGWLLVASVALHLIYSVGCLFNTESRLFKREFSIFGCFFIVFRAFVNQGSDNVPRSLSSRIVFYSSYFVMAMLLPAYSAALISYLTVKNPVRPFNSLEKMLESGTHKIMPAQKTADYNFFSEAKEPLLQEVFTKLVEPIKESTLPRNPKEGIEMVCKIKNVAYFGCDLSARLFAHDSFLKSGCKFMTFDQPITYIYKGIVFPKNSSYSFAINAELKRMMVKGLIKKYENEIWSPKVEIKNAEVEAIETRHVIQIYCIFLGGFFLAIFIFIIETFNCKR